MAVGRLIEKARSDVKKRIEGAFSVDLTLYPNYTSVTFVDGLAIPYVNNSGVLFTNVDGLDATSITISGLATRHRQSFDTDGLPVNAVNAHCTFFEQSLTDEGFATRNQTNDVVVMDWKVKWTDTVGELSYKIGEPMPDETVGLIKCELSEYE